jgi:hypothetical protein
MGALVATMSAAPVFITIALSRMCERRYLHRLASKAADTLF